MKPLFKSVLMLLVVAMIAGCGKKAEEAKVEAVPTPSGPVPAFSYTDAPTLEMIPQNGVWGEVNGTEFEPVMMYIEPGLEGWSLKVLEKQLDSIEDIFMDDARAVNVEFAKAPAAGQTYNHPMEFSDELNGNFLLQGDEDMDGDGVNEFTYWNSDNAYIVQITDWELAPFDPEASDFQEAGKASGKFAFCVPADDTYKASWVAGTFTDIPVRYSGEPAW